MKKLLLLLGLVIMLPFFSSAETKIYQFKTGTAQSITDDQSGSWINGNPGFNFSSNQTAGKYSGSGSSNRGISTSQTSSITSKTKFSNVQKIVVDASSNSTGNKLEVKVGNTVIGSIASLTNNNHTKYTFESSTPLSGAITFSVTRSAKTIWIAGFELTTGESNLTPAELAFEQTEYTATLGDDEFVSPQLVKKLTDGEVTYSSSNPAVAAVDAKTAELTLVGAGTTIITATSAETDTYTTGTASYTLTVVDPTIRYSSAMGEDFTFQNINLGSLTYVWTCDKSNGYLKASAYVSKKNNAAEAIACSPIIDLTDYRDLSLTFSAAYNYFGSVDAVKDYVSIVARQEGETEWTPIEAEITTADELDWIFVDNATIDLSAYSNTKMQFGFKYVSTTSVAGTWEVKNIVLRGKEGVDAKAPVLKVTASDGQTMEDGGDYEIVAGTVITAAANGAESITIVETDNDINISGTEWTPEAGVYNPVITATNNIGSSSIEFILTVKDDAKLAFAADAAVTGYEGEELNGLLIAENPHNVKVTYSSTNEDVVGVSADGSVLMLFAEGTANITATSEDAIYGGSASYTVTVLPGLGEITVNGKAVAEDETIVVYEGSKVVIAAENATSIVAEYTDGEESYDASASGSELEWTAELGEYIFTIEATLSTLSKPAHFTIKVDEAPQISTTTITAADFGINDTSYSEHTALCDGVSYLGQLNSDKDNTYFGLKKSEGAIVVTVNDEKVCSGITVTQYANQGTSKERQVLVYGSYEPFTKAEGITADSFSDVESVVKLGEAVMSKGKAVKVGFDENMPYYPYIAILSKTDVLQISSIDIEWTKRFDMPMVEHVHTGKLSEGGFVTFTLSHGKNANARIFHQHEPIAPAAINGLRVPSLSSDNWTEASFDDREVIINAEGKFHVYASDASGKNRSAVVTAIVEDTKTTSISEVVAEDGDAEYFDLQGRRIAAPAKGTIYLLKQGSKVSKRVL